MIFVVRSRINTWLSLSSVLMIIVYVLGNPKKCIFYFLFKRVEGLFPVGSLFGAGLFGLVFFGVGLIFIFIYSFIFIFVFLFNFVFSFCQAQPQLNSTQLQLKLRLRLALIRLSPATHPTTWKSSFLSLIDQLESWNFAQTLIRPTWLRYLISLT